MVQLIGIQAKRLKKAMTDNHSTERLMLDQWAANDINGMRSYDDSGEVDKFVAKLTHPIALVGLDREIDRNINSVTFLFKRKGAIYCDRIALTPQNSDLRCKAKYDEVAYRWNEIVRWVLNGEIDPDDDIVIYRTGGRSSNRVLNRFPIRLKDNTYGIVTGVTEALGYVYTKCLENDFDGRPVANFDDFNAEAIYKGCAVDHRREMRRRRFFYNGSQFTHRCRILYHYFGTYGHNIRDILNDIGMPHTRMNFLLWNDGKIRVWESADQDNDILKDGDHLPMLTYDDGHVSFDLINSDYGWSNEDNLFKIRWERSNDGRMGNR